jgi:hypothetical protein
MENDQNDPQGPSNLNDQPKNQAGPENRGNEVNPSGQTPNETDTRRNYSDESASAENRDYSHSPSDRTGTTGQPLGKTSETQKNEEKEEDNEEQEVKEIPHPHKRIFPESDDDFRHDM